MLPIEKKASKLEFNESDGRWQLWPNRLLRAALAERAAEEKLVWSKITKLKPFEPDFVSSHCSKTDEVEIDCQPDPY